MATHRGGKLRTNAPISLASYRTPQGKPACRCCQSENCGKRKGPYTKKRSPARGGVRRIAGWNPYQRGAQ